MYTQGTEEPPNKGMHERNFMITEGDYEHKQLLVNSPSLSDVKKFGGFNKPSRYYYGRDGLNQEDFLEALAQSGADEYEAYDVKDLEYYEEKAYERQYGSKMPGRNSNSRSSQGVRYVPAELPCLKEKEPLFSQWLKEQDAPTGFARAFPVDQASGFGGGKGAAPKDPSQKSGPPIGCCNGKPFSAKKRCCCRRKSYDTETEFCCVSPQGCAAFQTFTNTTENRNACMNIGGRIVLNEYFDYQATPMIGWASSKESARPYGPAYMQSAKSLDRELMIRYSDKVNNRGVDKSEKSEKKDEKEESAKTNKNKNDRNSNKNRPTDSGLNFEDFKMEELEEMTQELLDEMKAADIKYKSPNSAEAWRMDDLLSSRDHIDDLLSGENPFAWAGDSAV